MATAVANKLTVSIRMAQPDEGTLIGALAYEAGKREIAGMYWTFNPHPYWLIAEIEGTAAGCVQVTPGVPFGHIEFMCIPKHLRKREKALVVKTLSRIALQTCARMGAQFVTFIVDEELEGFKKVAKHRGCVKWYDGAVFIKAV